MQLVRADIGHLWCHLEAKNRQPPQHEYRLLVGEVLCGRAWAGLVGDQPLALGGVFDAGDGGPGFPWLSVVPGGLGRHLLPAVRHMRRVIDAAAGDYPHGLAASVDDANDNGQRLALALGLVPGGAGIGGLRWWTNGRHAVGTNREEAVRAGR